MPPFVRAVEGAARYKVTPYGVGGAAGGSVSPPSTAGGAASSSRVDAPGPRVLPPGAGGSDASDDYPETDENGNPVPASRRRRRKSGGPGAADGGMGGYDEGVSLPAAPMGGLSNPPYAGDSGAMFPTGGGNYDFTLIMGPAGAAQGDLIFVAVFNFRAAGASLPVLSYPGFTFTQQATVLYHAGGARLSLFTAPVPAGFDPTDLLTFGTAAFGVAQDASPGWCNVRCRSLSPVTPVVQAVTAAGTNAAPAATLAAFAAPANIGLAFMVRFLANVTGQNWTLVLGLFGNPTDEAPQWQANPPLTASWSLDAADDWAVTAFELAQQ